MSDPDDGSTCGIESINDGDYDHLLTGSQTDERFVIYAMDSAGDVNGDGFSEILVGAPNYPNNDAQGKVYLYSPGTGRQVLAGQVRGDGSQLPVQTWGLSHAADGFTAQMTATDPRGQGNVMLEVEACPAGMPFGVVTCTTTTSPDWTAVTTATTSVVLSETFTGLSESTVYAWRARVVYDSHSNPHGPWRRYLASSLAADLRVGDLPEILAVHPLDESDGVELTAPVVITFSEIISTTTFTYTVTPDPGGWMETWGWNGSVLTLTHDGFGSGMVYTVTVTAEDLVGNTLLDAPYAWVFEAEYRIYLPLVLKN